VIAAMPVGVGHVDGHVATLNLIAKSSETRGTLPDGKLDSIRMSDAPERDLNWGFHALNRSMRRASPLAGAGEALRLALEVH
jgi:hypothetical protein